MLLYWQPVVGNLHLFVKLCCGGNVTTRDLTTLIKIERKLVTVVGADLDVVPQKKTVHKGKPQTCKHLHVTLT